MAEKHDRSLLKRPLIPSAQPCSPGKQGPADNFQGSPRKSQARKSLLTGACFFDVLSQCHGFVHVFECATSMWGVVENAPQALPKTTSERAPKVGNANPSGPAFRSRADKPSNVNPSEDPVIQFLFFSTRFPFQAKSGFLLTFC